MRRIIGVGLWIAAVALVVILIIRNVDEIRTFDNTAIKSEIIIIGQSSVEPITEDTSLVNFLQRQYDLVMIDKDGNYNDRIVFTGKSGEQYYRAGEKVETKFLQALKEIKINDNSTEIIFGKDILMTIVLSVVIILFFGILGLMIYEN